MLLKGPDLPIPTALKGDLKRSLHTEPGISGDGSLPSTPTEVGSRLELITNTEVKG